MKKFIHILAVSLVFLPSMAFCEILNWNDKIPLTTGRVEYVVEVVTTLESEWKNEIHDCRFEKQESLQLINLRFDPQDSKLLQKFSIQSVLTVGGETCPGQEFLCETEFIYKGPKDWEVSASCEDPT